MKRILTLTILAALLTSLGLCQGKSPLSANEALSTLPVQSGGRLKPLDTLARESVRLVTGKSRFQGADPIITLLRWWSDPEATKSAEVIEFRNLALKKELGLEEDRRWYSFSELAYNDKLNAHREEIHQHLQNEEELHGDEQKIQDLLVKINVVHQAMEGHIFQAVPHPEGLKQDWGSFADLGHQQTIELVAPAKQALDELREAMLSNDSSKFLQASRNVKSALATIGPVPDESTMSRELRYNKAHPFRTAWLLYLAGLAILTFVKAEGRSTGYWAGFSFVVAGFLMHTYGFALRCMIAGRPPVTNMYESVIWVAFGAVLFALIFEVISAKRYYLMAASAGAIVCLVLADILPTVLDPSIRPLTPVLRSNFWLTIHVLSITLGYAAFLLALGVSPEVAAIDAEGIEHHVSQQTLDCFAAWRDRIG